MHKFILKITLLDVLLIFAAVDAAGAGQHDVTSGIKAPTSGINTQGGCRGTACGVRAPTSGTNKRPLGHCPGTGWGPHGRYNCPD
jgi:hypothetical protein